MLFIVEDVCFSIVKILNFFVIFFFDVVCFWVLVYYFYDCWIKNVGIKEMWKKEERRIC